MSKLCEVLYKVKDKLDEAIDTLEAIEERIGDTRNHLAYYKKVYDLRAKYPSQCGALLRNEILLDKFESYRHWRCMWLVRGDKEYLQRASKLLDELCETYDNTCDACKSAFARLSDDMGYELKVDDKMPCYPHVSIKTKDGLDGWSHGWEIGWEHCLEGLPDRDSYLHDYDD